MFIQDNRIWRYHKLKINRIKTHKTALGYLIMNNEVGIISGEFKKDEEENKNNSNSVPLLMTKDRSVVRDLDSTNDLVFVRIRDKIQWIMEHQMKNSHF